MLYAREPDLRLSAVNTINLGTDKSLVAMTHLHVRQAQNPAEGWFALMGFFGAYLVLCLAPALPFFF
jgi:hypothetical protein